MRYVRQRQDSRKEYFMIDGGFDGEVVNNKVLVRPDFSINTENKTYLAVDPVFFLASWIRDTNFFQRFFTTDMEAFTSVYSLTHFFRFIQNNSKKIKQKTKNQHINNEYLEQILKEKLVGNERISFIT